MINGWIYMIKDLTNNNIYVGSTMSKFGFKHRCGQHKNDLKRYLKQSTISNKFNKAKSRITVYFLNYHSYIFLLDN